MVSKTKTKKPEDEQGVAGSKGVQGSSRNNPPVDGINKASGEKGKRNERKEVKKVPVLDQSKDREKYTDDHKAPNPDWPWDDDVEFGPVYAFDASGKLVQVGEREILSQSSAEFQMMAQRQNQDDPYVYSDGDKFDAQEQREVFREWLGPRLIMPDGYQPDCYKPDDSPAPGSPDLKEKGSSISSNPPDEDPHKRMEETAFSTKQNKNKKKKKTKTKNKTEKKQETEVMSKKGRKEPDGDICVQCFKPPTNMQQAANCGHCFCLECVLNYIFNKHKQRNDMGLSVECPDIECKEVLTDVEIFGYIGDEKAFSWLTDKNNARMKNLQTNFANLKNVASAFVMYMNQNP